MASVNRRLPSRRFPSNIKQYSTFLADLEGYFQKIEARLYALESSSSASTVSGASPLTVPIPTKNTQVTLSVVVEHSALSAPADITVSNGTVDIGSITLPTTATFAVLPFSEFVDVEGDRVYTVSSTSANLTSAQIHATIHALTDEA